MLPIEVDHKVPGTIPVPTDKAINRVFDTLQTILSQTVTPYFRNNRGVSLVQLADLRQSTVFRRMEDQGKSISLPTILLRQGQKWTILIHERLFDYLAFTLPPRPEFSGPNGGREEQRVLKFSEFLLRHHFEHLVFPNATESDVIRSDIEFAADWKIKDPKGYQAFREVLSNPMNGINGRDYLELLDRAERGEECEFRLGRMEAIYARHVSELPGRFLIDLFPDLDFQMKLRVLNQLYRDSRLQGQPRSKIESGHRKLLRLFAATVYRVPSEGVELFKMFTGRWGIESTFKELDIAAEFDPAQPETRLFEIFKKHLEEFVEPEDILNQQVSHRLFAQSRTEPAPQPAKPLKERIDEARSDPDIPQSVVDLIEKNKMNAAGQSGAKYTELIETLLAIPWGKIKKIWVSPEEFDEGLNHSHYGLKKPKEIMSDFFANLIWRYQHFKESEKKYWHRTGSALLLVGPPGVGKTSLAISIARNLGIPYHKISLGGMKDEADIRGYGFTYEGSKPGPIVQGLIKMGVMNGMFIMDEADKTERFAIATLLEILDPEQNHLFHDKYTQSTVDIDLSNCHFILTANTVDTVPAAILNRCEVIFLDRYSVDEKISIAREFLVHRVRERYMIGQDEIFFDPEEENEILRQLIRDYTSEAGVRDLERIMRTLFLRIQRKEIMAEGKSSLKINLGKIRKYLDMPNRQRLINEDDRIGEMMGLGVNMEMGIGSLIPIQATPVRIGRDKKDGSFAYLSMVHTTGNIERVMDESRKVASTAILHLAEELRIDAMEMSMPVHLHFMGGSTKKDGPSAGAAIALALASLFAKRKIRRDVAVTGEIDTQGRVTGVGGMGVKLETAYAAGCKTMIIPKENLTGTEGIDRLPDALKQELQILTFAQWEAPHEPFDYTRHMLQVIAVDDIIQASEIAFIDQEEIDSLDNLFEEHALRTLEETVSAKMANLRMLRVVYLDNPDEADSSLLRSDFCREGHQCILLVRSDLKEEILKKMGDLSWNNVIRGFDPETERLIDVLREIKNEYRDNSAPPLSMSLVAPLAFLQKEGIRPEQLYPGEGFAGLRIFANCCTTENMRVRDCSTMLARSFSSLEELTDKLLEMCPFMAKKDGIYASTVAFIPEKYRIDGRRAEEILNRGLLKWLNILGSRGEEPAPQARL
ncbi:MAG: S16 family serine protease [Syntrophobacteraceae bacterium]|jgi:ATP-dependent Lon protease